MPNTVTVRHWGGQQEDIPADEARRLAASGFIWILSELPPAETAMAAPPETAMLAAPPARQMYGKKKPRKPRKRAS